MRLDDAPAPGRVSRAMAALLAAAVAVPVVFTGVSAWLSWRVALRNAEQEVVRTADAVSEYTRRTLDGQRVAVDRINDLLRGLSDEDIRAQERQLHERLRAVVAELPQAQTAYVGDRQGRLLVSASVYPVPREAELADREWNQALSRPEAPPVFVSRVHRGRVEDNLFIAVARRRSNTGNALPAGAYDGQANATISPAALSQGLRRLAGAPEDVITVLRLDGEILARSNDATMPLPPQPALAQDMRREAEGNGIIRRQSPIDGVERIGAARLVEGYPLVVTAARARQAVMREWGEMLALQLAAGVPAAAALVLLALAVRRRQLALTDAAGELELRVQARTAELAESEDSLRLALATAEMGVWSWRVQADELRWDDRAAAIMGWPLRDKPVTRASFRAIVAAEDQARVQHALDHAQAMGAPYECIFRITRPADGEERWLESRARRVVLSPGEHEWRGVLADVTDRIRAEERQRLLMREVDHRAKNALAVVQSMLRLTRAEDLESFIRTVEGRVAALARAQTLLSEAKWHGADLRVMAQGELMPFLSAPESGRPRVMLEGPAMVLAPGAAQPLSMVLHELATNAAKHGALSTPEGRVLLRWQIDQEAGVLRIIWQESGGPPVTLPPDRQEPQRRGFGSRVIQATVADQLGGAIERHWEPGGLRCEVSIPLARALQEDGQD